MGLLDEVDRRRQKSEQNKENSARLAQSYSIFRTTGQGTHQYPDKVVFGVTFSEKPIVSYGCAIDIDELAGELDYEDEDDTPIPLVSGYVVNWEQDDHGFYTGCWVAVRVYFPFEDAVVPSAEPEVEHHFTFAAIGLKEIPVDAGDAVGVVS